MALTTRYNSQDEIPEDVRQDFVEDTVNEQFKGTWVPKDLFNLEKALYAERREHKDTKDKLGTLTGQLQAVQDEIDKIHELGSLEELIALREKADKANPPDIEQLKKDNAEMRGKLKEATKWRSENEPRLAALEAEQTKYRQEADRASAKASIAETVKGIQGVNADALSEVLYCQYLAGMLKRNDGGDIVKAADGADLEEYAAKYAKDHGLLLQSVSGKSTPPTGAPGGSTLASLKKQYEEAKQKRDSLAMLRIKNEIDKLTS